MSDNIYTQISNFVTGLFKEPGHEYLIFHDLSHTQQVVEHSQEIAAHYALTPDEMLTLYAAAWFHDVGHLYADIEVHEEKSVEIMRSFMQQCGYEDNFIDGVAKCIMATRMPHDPHSMLEEIMCDADTYHFGTNDFKSTNKAIHKEYELRNNHSLLEHWEQNTLNLLQSHRFFTSYCQTLLTKGKLKNIQRAKKKLHDSEEDDAQEHDHGKKDKHKKKHDEHEDEQQELSGKNKLITRGIQTMLRLTSENHLELSNMADGKANILISVNSIIISVILSVLLRKLESEQYLTIPTIIFLLFSVITVVIAILATRPKITEGRFSRQDIIDKKTNLLFFGNFHKSSLEEYQWGMKEMMMDKDYLYGSLVKDIHHLGVVLGRKYKLIRMAYNVFMIGIIISVLAFGIAVAMHNPQETTIITSPTTAPL
ncbi:MAG: HD domain-containing protein [Sphingobacteriales bacterium]|nr:MAG: HD domain-containing protein [Sphingobacteriales bacterium]